MERKKIELEALVFSQPAGAAITEFILNLEIFSQMTGSGDVEVWGEVKDNGDLVVKAVVKTASGGKIKGGLEIPSEHWDYAQ